MENRKEKTMDFGYVLKRAWEIIWKFKILWLSGSWQAAGKPPDRAEATLAIGFKPR
jgi:hypothetical protein